MVINPIEYIERIIDYIEFFTFHYESEGELDKIINPPNNLPSDEKLLIQLYESLNKGGSE